MTVRWVDTSGCAGVCPVLCSGQGDYTGGECVCKPGWKGKECSVRYEECEVVTALCSSQQCTGGVQVPDCSGHGHCQDGKCLCMKGYQVSHHLPALPADCCLQGEFCMEPDCPDPACSGRGECLAGVCHCSPGWAGEACQDPQPAILSCLPDCGQGRLDSNTGRCVCNTGWTGPACNVTVTTDFA